MKYFHDLPGSLVKQEPALWLKRVAIFSKITPRPELIRDIHLQPGLNVIWAEEIEDQPGEIEITGHSAGKTTFCRLVRYLLGEETYGKKINVERIKKVLPAGYVAAELSVLEPISGDRHEWAVMRPIGNNRFSHIRQDASIEALLDNRGDNISQKQYLEKLGFVDLMNQIATARIIRTDEEIQWGHLLAWCTRDQECRFQNIHEWRSPRSEHTSPSFRQPKDGPLFVMRAALGLFMDDELKAEETLAAMCKERDLLQERLERLKQEPRLKRDLLREEIRAQLSILYPGESLGTCPDFRKEGVLFDESLETKVEKFCETLQHECDENEVAIEAKQVELDRNGASIQQIEQLLEQLDILLKINSSTQSELDGGTAEKEKYRNLIEENGNKLCLFGGVLYKECSHIQKRQNTLDITEYKDDRAIAQHRNQIEQKRQRLVDNKRSNQEQLAQLEEDKTRFKKERDDLVRKRVQKSNAIDRIKHSWEEFTRWHHIVENTDGNEALKNTSNRLTTIDSDIQNIKQELEALIKKHAKHRNLLSQTYSRCVRSVLKSNRYDGEFTLKNRELNFQISHGYAMNGEAVETLSVLLSDLTCLIFNAINQDAVLPGFMLHDSPREADLGKNIYSNYIRFIAELHNMLGGEKGCPFQYIMTTTTAPPAEIVASPNNYVRLRLNASDENGLLLRKNIFDEKNEATTSIINPSDR